jgi:hypothetical protein
MSQTRRTSTAKLPAQKGLVELSDSLKNAHQPVANPITLVKPRRPPAARTGDAPKESLPQRDTASDPSHSPQDRKSVIPMGVTGHPFFSKDAVPTLGAHVVIQIPYEMPAWDDPDLNNMVSSEGLDDLESTTRGDLQFTLDCTVLCNTDNSPRGGDCGNLICCHRE